MNVQEQEKEGIQNEIWRLNKKADQNRSCHGKIAEDLRLRNQLLNVYIAIGSAIGTVITFAKIPDEYFLLAGCLSTSVVIASVLSSTFNLGKSIEDRMLAVNLWGKWIRDAQNFGNIEIWGMNKDQARQRLKELNESYKDVMDKTISIPDSKFNILKQKHLQKVEISKELDKNPFESISSIKKRLKRAHQSRASNCAVSSEQLANRNSNVN